MDTSKLEVLYSDNHLIAVNKKAGQLVQADGDDSIPLDALVKAWIKEEFNKPGEVFLGVIHRLDRPVSGVVLFARTSKSLARMNLQFKERMTKKEYLAIVCSPPPKMTDRLTHFISRDTKKNVSTANSYQRGDAKEATLNYTHLGGGKNYHYLQILLETGRHHQIRAQLKSIGCSIKGDLKYGSPRSNKDGDICLHAWRLSFLHPVTKEKVVIKAPLPKENPWPDVQPLTQ